MMDGARLVAMLQFFDFVFQKQLLAFEFVEMDVVTGPTFFFFGDLLGESLVTALQLTQMRI